MNNQSNLLSKNDGKSEKGTTDDDDVDDAGNQGGRKRAADKPARKWKMTGIHIRRAKLMEQ